MPTKRKYEKVKHHSVTAKLSEDEIAAINAKRPPSERIKPERYCGAMTNSGQPRPCKQKAGAGTSHVGWGHCSTHGGSTPAGERHAARLAGEEIIEQTRNNLVRFGGDRNDPSVANLTAEQALMEEVRRSAAMVRWLEEMIGQWDYDDPTHRESVDSALEAIDAMDPLKKLKGLPVLVSETAKGNSQLTDQAEWLKIYRDERAHLAHTAKMCIDAGIAHRMVSIAEDQGRVLASAIRATLTLLGLSQMQTDLVPQIVPPILRAVVAGAPIPEDLPALPAPALDPVLEDVV